MCIHLFWGYSTKVRFQSVVLSAYLIFLASTRFSRVVSSSPELSSKAATSHRVKGAHFPHGCAACKHLGMLTCTLGNVTLPHFSSSTRHGTCQYSTKGLIYHISLLARSKKPFKGEVKQYTACLCCTQCFHSCKQEKTASQHFTKKLSSGQKSILGLDFKSCLPQSSLPRQSMGSNVQPRAALYSASLYPLLTLPSLCRLSRAGSSPKGRACV